MHGRQMSKRSSGLAANETTSIGNIFVAEVLVLDIDKFHKEISDMNNESNDYCVLCLRLSIQTHNESTQLYFDLRQTCLITLVIEALWLHSSGSHGRE